MIPRFVFQTFPTNKLPEPYLLNLYKNKKISQDWDFILYDDASILDFINKEYGSEMFKRYKRINPSYGAARADLFRYLLMYKKGGIYIDIKVNLTRSLSEVIRNDDVFLLGRWPDCGEPQYSKFGRYSQIADPNGEFQQWFIACEASHPFLKAVIQQVCLNIDSYDSKIYGAGRWGTLNTTGPIPYTNAITPILNNHPHRIVRSFTDLGAKYSMFNDEFTHHTLFSNHYSNQTAPLIEWTKFQRAVKHINRLANSIRARI